MLESIHYQNFQTHRDRTLEFDEFVNCLIGSTDSGKSSALRGLIWILLNRPRGDGFITRGEEECINTLEVDGHEISRGRRKSLNFYTLDESPAYEAFGSGVPEDISKILSVDPISVQTQLDPPFWFLLSPGELSRELNSIVNLELIDEVLEFFASRQRKSKISVSLSEEKLEKARKRRVELAWVPELEVRLEDVEEKEIEISKLQSKSEKLLSILDYLENVDGDIERIDTSLAPLESLVSLGEDLQKEEKVYASIRRLLGDIRDNKVRLAEVEEQAREIEEKIKEETEGKCPICGGDLE